MLRMGSTFLLRMVIGRLRKWLTVVRSFKTGLGRLGQLLPPKIAKIHVCPKLGGKFGVLDSWLRPGEFERRGYLTYDVKFARKWDSRK